MGVAIEVIGCGDSGEEHVEHNSHYGAVGSGSAVNNGQTHQSGN